MKKVSLTSILFYGSVLILGIFLRVGASSQGFNFDMESFYIVSQIVDADLSVYEHTTRYNYGPLWFLTLGGLFKLAQIIDPAKTFSLLATNITFLLTLADIGIMIILSRLYGRVIAAIFFLNPISILISGYHRQFDNIAIFIGMFSIWQYQKLDKKPQKILPLILLGISLAFKHILFMFPMWIAFKEKTIKRKLLAMLIPFGIFLGSFIPFRESIDGIIKNVFQYESYANAPFHNFILPEFISQLISPTLFFILILLLIGYVFRKKDFLQLFFIYLISVVLFAPAIANQYLAIPTSAIVVSLNIFFVIYLIFSGLFILVDYDGLDIVQLQSFLPQEMIRSQTAGRAYDWLIVMLFIGFVYYMRKDIIRLIIPRTFFQKVLGLLKRKE